MIKLVGNKKVILKFGIPFTMVPEKLPIFPFIIGKNRFFVK